MGLKQKQIGFVRSLPGKSKGKFFKDQGLYGTSNGGSLSAAMSGKRNRKDLARLYGMEPVSDEIYDTIMRADNGRATPEEHRALDQYIKEKTSEIKRVKYEKDLEGGGYLTRPGRIAGMPVDMRTLIIQNEEKEDRDEL